MPPSADAGPLGGTLLQGKALSYNNLLDLDAAWQAAASFADPAVVIVKHLSPCGIAYRPHECRRRLPRRPGQRSVSRPLAASSPSTGPSRASFAHGHRSDADLFVEAVVARPSAPARRTGLPSTRPAAASSPSGDVDLVLEPASRLELRAIRDGYLVQEQDLGDPKRTAWEVVTARQPDNDDEVEALRFAWQAVTYVKSNAIVLAQP
jgi:phosphoribosylaminoimidazolecarboxamide formyltransferase / IMP cyclohydrolase